VKSGAKLKLVNIRGGLKKRDLGVVFN